MKRHKAPSIPKKELRKKKPEEKSLEANLVILFFLQQASLQNTPPDCPLNPFILGISSMMLLAVDFLGARPSKT